MNRSLFSPVVLCCRRYRCSAPRAHHSDLCTTPCHWTTAFLPCTIPMDGDGLAMRFSHNPIPCTRSERTSPCLFSLFSLAHTHLLPHRAFQSAPSQSDTAALSTFQSIPRRPPYTRTNESLVLGIPERRRRVRPREPRALTGRRSERRNIRF